jgi:2-C-methyl-D-erythritol 4-phosphate cytidylyltransferase
MTTHPRPGDPGHMQAGAVIVAAGRSTRMGGIDKLIAPLHGKPLVAHSIAAFATHEAIDEVVVVVSEENRDAIEALIEDEGLDARVVLGGERRRDSVRHGLAVLHRCDYVLVHDAARPLVTPALIEEALHAAREFGAALCALPVTDTVKLADETRAVQATLDRDGLWLAQTPQAFRLELLLRAHAATNDDATDDASLVEELGEPVHLVAGSSRNLKVTTPADLVIAEALMALEHQ